jgi:hypothetical protein
VIGVLYDMSAAEYGFRRGRTSWALSRAETSPSIIARRPEILLVTVRRPVLELTSIQGSGGWSLPLRWLDYDPIAVVVLMFGIGAVSLLALGM